MDNRDLIVQELEKYGGYKKDASAYRMVVCPFHDDRNPSCGVKIEHGSTLGDFHCFGCGERGSWNKFAEKTGLLTINVWDNTVSVGHVDINTRTHLYYALTKKDVFSEFGVPEAVPWIDSIDWRGFSGRFLNRVGAYIAYDQYKNTAQVLFLVEFGGEIRGGVKAVFQKGKGSSYFTTKGNWVNQYGLLFFKQARTLIKNNGYNFVVLVEGPRDALRLLRNGIPAIATLGAEAVSKEKAMLVETLDIDTVYCLPDNDSGGEVLWRNVRSVFKTKAKKISLPKELDSDGKLIKIDPYSMNLDTLQELVDFLSNENRFNLQVKIR